MFQRKSYYDSKTKFSQLTLYLKAQAISPELLTPILAARQRWQCGQSVDLNVTATWKNYFQKRSGAATSLRTRCGSRCRQCVGAQNLQTPNGIPVKSTKVGFLNAHRFCQACCQLQEIVCVVFLSCQKGRKWQLTQLGATSRRNSKTTNTLKN